MELNRVSCLIILNISGKREIANGILCLDVIMDLMCKNN